MLGSLQRRDLFSGNSPSLSCSQVWTGTFCLICILRLSSHTPLPFSCPISFFIFDSLAYFCPLFYGEGIEGRKSFSRHQSISRHYIYRQKWRQKDWADTSIQLLARGRVDLPGTVGSVTPSPSSAGGTCRGMLPVRSISAVRERGEKRKGSPWGVCCNRFLWGWMVNIL